MYCSFGMFKLISVYDIEQNAFYIICISIDHLAYDELDETLTKSPEYMNSACSQCTNALMNICRGFYQFKGSSDSNVGIGRMTALGQERRETWYIMAFIKLLWFLVTSIPIRSNRRLVCIAFVFVAFHTWSTHSIAMWLVINDNNTSVSHRRNAKAWVDDWETEAFRMGERIWGVIWVETSEMNSTKTPYSMFVCICILWKSIQSYATAYFNWTECAIWCVNWLCAMCHVYDGPHVCIHRVPSGSRNFSIFPSMASLPYSTNIIVYVTRTMERPTTNRYNCSHCFVLTHRNIIVRCSNMKFYTISGYIFWGTKLQSQAQAAYDFWTNMYKLNGNTDKAFLFGGLHWEYQWKWVSFP